MDSFYAFIQLQRNILNITGNGRFYHSCWQRDLQFHLPFGVLQILSLVKIHISSPVASLVVFPGDACDLQCSHKDCAWRKSRVTELKHFLTNKTLPVFLPFLFTLGYLLSSPLGLTLLQHLYFTPSLLCSVSQWNVDNQNK